MRYQELLFIPPTNEPKKNSDEGRPLFCHLQTVLSIIPNKNLVMLFDVNVIETDKLMHRKNFIYHFLGRRFIFFNLSIPF